MSDPIAGFLFELYRTNTATAYSNLLVGIVFGEQRLQTVTKMLVTVPCPSPILPPEKNPYRDRGSYLRNSFIYVGAYVVIYGTSLYILL